MFSFIYSISYNLIWLFAQPIFGFFFRYEVESKEDLKNLKGPLIIVSDHGSWIDPFLISTAFPFLSKIFPIHYGCWHKYFYSPRFFPWILLVGAFPIKKGLDFDQSLKTPLRILKNKGVVALFPEGRRKLGGRPRRARRGATFLHYRTKAKILPVKIEGNFHINLKSFLLRRRHIKVKIGKTFSLPAQKIQNIEELNKPSGLIMEKIREL